MLGHTWATLYDSLVLHTGKHLSALPGMAFPRSTPLFPSRGQFLEYLGRYAAEFRLPVQTDAEVTTVVRANGAGWMVHTRDASVRARALVVATGIASNPTSADIPGAPVFSGRVIHSRDYRRPDEFVRRRVLVVGVGNSAGEIAAEIAAAGALVTVAIRSGARVVPRQILGIPAQYFAVATRRLPRRAQQSILSGVARVSALIRGPSVLPPPRDNACAVVPLIGFHLVDAIRAGAIHVKPAIDRFTTGGVRFADGSETPFDDVILATGYRPARGVAGRLDHGGWLRLSAPARRRRERRSAGSLLRGPYLRYARRALQYRPRRQARGGADRRRSVCSAPADKASAPALSDDPRR